MTANFPLMRIGLTGGIGSGKSTVAHMLHARGAAVIDADLISRRLTAPNGPAMPSIKKAFGEKFVDHDGSLNRELMRGHIFAHAQAKNILETILHPLVAAQMQHQAQSAIDSGHRTLVFDIPLLIETKRWRTQVDRILLIDCALETQIQRVIARNRLSRETAQHIIAHQASRPQRLSASDWVIYNDKISIEHLQQLVGNLPIFRT